MRVHRMVIAVLAGMLIAACNDANTPMAPEVPDPLGSLADGGHGRSRPRLGSISGMKCLVTPGQSQDDDDDDAAPMRISLNRGRDDDDERGEERDHGRDHVRGGRCERDDDRGAGVAGWTITLTGNDYEGRPVSLSTVTGPRGKYLFLLRPGTYTVCEEMKPGFAQVFPSAGASCPAETFGYEVVLRSGQMARNRDFGNQPGVVLPPPTGRIEGAVLITGTPDGMSDWAVFLFDATGAPVAQTLTLMGGAYAFTDLPAGTYLVCEDLPIWMTLDQQSAPVAGDPGTAHCAGNGTVGYLITITGGEVITERNFFNAIAG